MKLACLICVLINSVKEISLSFHYFYFLNYLGAQLMQSQMQLKKAVKVAQSSNNANTTDNNQNTNKYRQDNR